MSFKLLVGKRLNQIRGKHQKTQAEFAEMLDLSESAYGRIERGESQIDMDMLVRFSQKLNLPLTDFLPDSVTSNIHGNIHGVGQNVYGTFNYYANPTEQTAQLETENAHLRQKLSEQDEKLSALAEQIAQLKAALEK